MGQALERIAVPVLALLASAVLFGLLLAVYARVDPFETFALMYQGAFGSWFSWQNTLTRAAPLILTALCTARVEAAIRRAPEQWFWMHNRWRTRPPTERRPPD